MHARYFQRRFLFGYDPAEVDKALSDHERTTQQLLDEKREIEQRCLDLEAKLAAPRSLGASDIDGAAVPLRRGLLGYRRTDVRRLVGELTRQLDDAHREQQDMLARVRAAQQELDQWRRRQHQLDELALRAAADAANIEQRAAEQARALLADADRSARRTVADAKAEIERQFAQARPQIERHRVELRRLATLQQELSGAIRHAMAEFDRSLQRAAVPAEAAGIGQDTGYDEAATPTATVHELREQRGPTMRQETEADAAGSLSGDPTDVDAPSLRHRVRIVPIDDYADLARLVRRLGQIAGVEGVFVQSFEADVAELSVHLSPGAAIDQALERLEGARVESSAGDDEDVSTVHLVTTAEDH